MDCIDQRRTRSEEDLEKFSERLKKEKSFAHVECCIKGRLEKIVDKSKIEISTKQGTIKFKIPPYVLRSIGSEYEFFYSGKVEESEEEIAKKEPWTYLSLRKVVDTTRKYECHTL